MINATKKWIFLKISSAILVLLMIWFLFNLISFYDKDYDEVINEVEELMKEASVDASKFIDLEIIRNYTNLKMRLFEKLNRVV